MVFISREAPPDGVTPPQGKERRTPPPGPGPPGMEGAVGTMEFTHLCFIL